MKDKILTLISTKGPVIPRDISKHFNVDSMVAGAHLSELIANKKIRVSTAKIGGSPVYYLENQRAKLDILYPHLNEKDQKAYDLLKTNIVLLDRNEIPVVRVAMRSLKDFAIPLNIKTTNSTDLFWKWHLADENETNLKISKILDERLNQNEAIPKKIIHETDTTESKINDNVQPLVGTIEISNDIDKTYNLHVDKNKITDKVVKVENDSVLSPIRSDKQQRQKKSIPAQIVNKKVLSDDFNKRLNQYFKGKGIKVIETQIIRKNSEIDYIIKIPSVVGEIEYYCKTKNKKKCNDGDLSSAFVQGQLKKIPTIFISPGQLTKKAQEMLGREFKNHLIFKKIE